MRFCHRDGRLELSYKGTIADRHPDLVPWFEIEPRANKDIKIIFGHWAALNGEVDLPNLYALDTGCVWGNKLTAMRLEDRERLSVAVS
jgi:bis(5'-nucleosyl)-tetraphosphatase (symmetrical)